MVSIIVTAICRAREMVSKGSWSEIIQITCGHQRITSARREHHRAHWAEAAIAAHSQRPVWHDHWTAIRRRYECHAVGHYIRVVPQRAAINERFQINAFNVIHSFMCRCGTHCKGRAVSAVEMKCVKFFSQMYLAFTEYPSVKLKDKRVWFVLLIWTYLVVNFTVHRRWSVRFIFLQ